MKLKKKPSNQASSISPGPVFSRRTVPKAAANPAQPKKGVHLYDAVKVSYTHKNEAKKSLERLKKGGYVHDTELSNHNQTVLYNPEQKKLLVTVAGTHNTKDYWTDLGFLARGTIKGTDRVKEAKRVSDQAREKYKPEQEVYVGHSLGGEVARNIAPDNALIYTFNKASLGAKNRKNETAVRSAFDFASFPNAFDTGTKNINYSENPLTTRNLIGPHHADRLQNHKDLLV